MPVREPLLIDANPLPEALTGDLRRQLEFVVEVDRMKAILRQSPVAAVERRENDAEHSWHLALMVIVLSEYAREPVDRARVIELVVLHDLVEIYAGDTSIHDPAAAVGQAEREAAAADRLFAVLPEEQGQRLRDAWEEFEAHVTPEARFARSMDRMQPVLLNWMAEGGSWVRESVTAEKLRSRVGIIADGSPALWAATDALIEEGERRGYLAPADADDGAQ